MDWHTRRTKTLTTGNVGKVYTYTKEADTSKYTLMVPSTENLNKTIRSAGWLPRWGVRAWKG